jgi:ankyrin repeat protein
MSCVSNIIYFLDITDSNILFIFKHFGFTFPYLETYYGWNKNYNEAFVKSFEIKNSKLCQYFLEKGATINTIKERMDVMDKELKEKKEIIQCLLEASNDFLLKKQLFNAISENNFEKMKIFIHFIDFELDNYYCDVSEYDNDDYFKYEGNCFWAAIKYGNIKIIKYMVEKQNANINYVDSNGENSLCMAAQYDHLKVVKYLLSKNANIYCGNKYYKTSAIECAIKNNKRLDIIKLLYTCTHKESTNNTNNLIDAVKYSLNMNGRLSLVKYLVEDLHVNIELQDTSRKSALIYAAKNNNFDILKYLVDQNANVNVKDDSGNTALIYSAKMNSEKAIKYLVLHGANINEENKMKERAFSILLKSFIKNKDFYKESNPKLNKTIRKSNLKIIKYLCEQKANTNNIEINEGISISALQYASNHKDYEIVKILNHF